MLGLQLVSSRFGNLFYVDFYMDRYIMYLWYICIWNNHFNIIIMVIWLELEGWKIVV